MDLIKQYLQQFSDRGGEFLLPLSDFILKARDIRCIAFDWDGVYNSGVKGEGVYSYFSEVDSMGLNILRFGAKIVNGEILKAGIISGEKNPSTRMPTSLKPHSSTTFRTKSARRSTLSCAVLTLFRCPTPTATHTWNCRSRFAKAQATFSTLLTTL